MRLADLVSHAERRWRPIAPTRPSARRVMIVGGVAVGSILVSTGLVAALENAVVGIADASPVYLIAVVAVGTLAGLWPAVATAIASFIVYDVLFTEPRYSIVVADAREWLDLLLFLFVALVIGRLVAVQHARADDAARRAAEASSLFALSRSLALAGSTADAAPAVAARLAADAGFDRIIIVAGPVGAERVIADTDPGRAPPNPSLVTMLVRTSDDEPARWIRTHVTGGSAATEGDDHYRIRIEIDGVQLGAITAVRRRGPGTPGREATRVLALAADQLATSLRRDELRRIATDLEVARQGDALKTALIDSVSHDLRTPLAGIRATAGGLSDPDVAWTDDDRRAAAAVIDAEATRLDRLVSGLLDLGRIASGAVHPELEPHEAWAIVLPAVDRLTPALGERPIRVDVPDDLPPVLVDAALLDNVVTNLVDNVARHAPPPAPVSVRATVRSGRGEQHDAAGSAGWIDLTVEDGGPGVPDATLGRLFDRFERAHRTHVDARDGLGIGLSVVKGLVEAMGGSVRAGRSPLGGLAVTVTLPAAARPDDRP